MNPQISIIVPVYNVEQYLSRCIDSILNQTFSDFELLLIDDGSPDNSGNICDEYAQKDNRIRVFHKENGGVSSARNVGLDNARGEWISFIDSDDTIFEYFLETLISMTSCNIDSVIGGYIQTDCCMNEYDMHPIDGIWNYKKVLLDFYVPIYKKFNGYLWNRLFRHIVIKENHLRFNENIFYKEDGLFLVQFVCCSKRNSVITTKPIYKYHINPGSAMQSFKQTFNKKYLTNMNARVLCWESIKSATKWYDFKLRFEAKRSIVQFYYVAIYYLNHHQIQNMMMVKDLHSKMKQNVWMPYLYRFYDLGLVTIRKIKRLLLCK